jgi:hypothetical protein
VTVYGAIDTCAYADDWSSSEDNNFLVHFRQIARNHVSISNDIRRAGYPSQVWAKQLNDLTRERVRAIASAREMRRHIGTTTSSSTVNRAVREAADELVYALNSYRSTYDRSLPRYSSGGECGGDWIGYVKLTTAPPNGRILVIIPNPIDQNPWAHWRSPMDMMRQG